MTSSSERREPARVDLEDFIAAVARGVERALEAQEDTGGFAAPGGQAGLVRPITGRPPIIMGIIAYPPFGPNGLPGTFGTGDFGAATLAR